VPAFQASLRLSKKKSLPISSVRLFRCSGGKTAFADLNMGTLQRKTCFRFAQTVFFIYSHLQKQVFDVPVNKKTPTLSCQVFSL
jgi:hypothetical protein